MKRDNYEKIVASAIGIAVLLTMLNNINVINRDNRVSITNDEDLTYAYELESVYLPEEIEDGINKEEVTNTEKKKKNKVRTRDYHNKYYHYRRI